MIRLRQLVAAAGALLLAGAAIACIEPLDLGKMMSRTDTAVLGEITQVRTVLHNPENEDRMIYTIVTVQGEDIYTGQARTLEAAFLGGTYQGDSMLVTSMPAPSEYQLGKKVLTFGAAVSDWGSEINHAMYASYGGLFQTVATNNGVVVLGKGQDFAIEKNIALPTLRKQISKIKFENKEVK
ncbi:MAG: hypothetical protein HN405_03120 [Planctomycetes bacterium]|jgi:hypothetical protein|nr:hypothetical protein [Planctomycetota bacterium]MBT4029319.1 hypothetical protein [Planctomycetota bacterium]MBT4561304.1 hypothetical protein [Planctomycetota bacterium]MBT5101394.1 hypothetical protein [Planctomycetota bacterium]MBT7012642.1 hypothetical protein [Planctomycetota bacterium]